MDLSIIIVNYNVKYFLEQCLYSVEKAIRSNGIAAEVIVIDNHSSDESLTYLRRRFSSVIFFENDANIGFSRACNRACVHSSGRFLLFLNPDTLIPEDSLSTCIRFLEKTPVAGAVGVQMIDGRGRFLRESKRSFPSPATALYKLSGLARLFPHSRRFGKYHLGYLPRDEDHEVDVLAGAFLMTRREIFDRLKGFDESFFMYGEDIDLSYRIQQAGYKNYYLASPAIIHFKGESTRKGTLNYVRMFYLAMSVFVSRHYRGSRARMFLFFIHAAIWMRAALSAVGRVVRWVGLPILDAGLILLSFWLVKNVWSAYMRPNVDYPDELVLVSLPCFTFFYLVVAYYGGLYDKRYRVVHLIRASAFATLTLLAAYSLLPESLRFSRAIVVFGALAAFAFIGLLRWLLIASAVLEKLPALRHPQTVIVGAADEAQHVSELLKRSGMNERILGRIAVSDNDPLAAGKLTDLHQLTGELDFREVIFCEGELSFADIIAHLQGLPKGLHVKFHAAGSQSIIGSDYTETAGEVFANELFDIADPYNRRTKRLIDFVSALLLLITFPIHMIFVNNRPGFFMNCFSVLFAARTWVGYLEPERTLPVIRRGVIGPNGLPVSTAAHMTAESRQAIDKWYALDYEPLNDLRLIFKGYRYVGN
ncbi:MAG TPA: glycosyltransferase [Chitinophagaceae bacterium]|jgi:GT2 family glycosyltransferase